VHVLKGPEVAYSRHAGREMGLLSVRFGVLKAIMRTSARLPRSVLRPAVYFRNRLEAT
jgi:hypothetical protein